MDPFNYVIIVEYIVSSIISNRLTHEYLLFNPCGYVYMHGTLIVAFYFKGHEETLTTLNYFLPSPYNFGKLHFHPPPWLFLPLYT